MPAGLGGGGGDPQQRDDPLKLLQLGGRRIAELGPVGVQVRRSPIATKPEPALHRLGTIPRLVDFVDRDADTGKALPGHPPAPKGVSCRCPGLLRRP